MPGTGPKTIGSLTVSLKYYATNAAMAHFKVYQNIAKERLELLDVFLSYVISKLFAVCKISL